MAFEIHIAKVASPNYVSEFSLFTNALSVCISLALLFPLGTSIITNSLAIQFIMCRGADDESALFITRNKSKES